MTGDHDAISDHLDRVEAKTDLVLEILTGNGTPSKGLVVRVDRIEQRSIRHSWWTRTALGTAIAAAVLTGWKIVTGSS